MPTCVRTAVRFVKHGNPQWPFCSAPVFWTVQANWLNPTELDGSLGISGGQASDKTGGQEARLGCQGAVVQVVSSLGGIDATHHLNVAAFGLVLDKVPGLAQCFLLAPGINIARVLVAN